MSIGGTEQVIKQLVQSIDKSSFDVSILCLDNHIGELGFSLREHGCEIHKFARNHNGLDIRLILKLHHFLTLNKFDIVHCHQYTPYIYGLLSSFGTNTCIIFTEHGRFYPDKYRLKRYLINPILSYLTCSVTAISNSTADALSIYENFPRENIRTIYNGINDLSNYNFRDIDLKVKLNIHDNLIVLGTVSRLDPIKNQEMLLNAFKIVKSHYPNTVLLFVGDGPSKTKLIRLAKSLNLYESVIFTGYKLNTHEYIHIMEVFLLPSLSEGTSMTLLEAMSLSKPCVVTAVGGNPEIMIDHRTGFVVPNNDVTSFSNAIIKLIEDDVLRKDMGSACRQRYESLFTNTKMINQYTNLYREILSCS
jgi:glycosyltransferase involved in cell wall biosynthesis